QQTEPPADLPAGDAGGPSDGGYRLPDSGPVPETLTALRARWDEVRAAARKRDVRAGGLLNQAEVKSFDGKRVEVGVRYDTHVNLIRTTGNGQVLQAIQAAFADVVGHPVEVEPVLWEELSQVGDAPPPKSDGGGHLVEE